MAIIAATGQHEGCCYGTGDGIVLPRTAVAKPSRDAFTHGEDHDCHPQRDAIEQDIPESYQYQTIYDRSASRESELRYPRRVLARKVCHAIWGRESECRSMTQ